MVFSIFLLLFDKRWLKKQVKVMLFNKKVLVKVGKDHLLIFVIFFGNYLINIDSILSAIVKF